MKNKRLMGIIGLIAAAVIGTAIYSATAGKDNKAASSNEKAKVGVLQLVSHPSLDLIYKGIQDGLAEEGYDKDKVDIDFLNAEGDQNKVATMSKQLVDKDNQVLGLQPHLLKVWPVQPKTNQLSWELSPIQSAQTWSKI